MNTRVLCRFHFEQFYRQSWRTNCASVSSLARLCMTTKVQHNHSRFKRLLTGGHTLQYRNLHPNRCVRVHAKIINFWKSVSYSIGQRSLSNFNDNINGQSGLHHEDHDTTHRDLHLAILEEEVDGPIQDIRSPRDDEGGVVTSRIKEILRGVYHGDRAKLAEAITLVESKHPVKHKQAQWLLTKVLSHRSKLMQLGKLKPTLRIGLSGPPGAGKSTLIETFGQLLTGQGYRIGVLAVDPSSSRTGGSIMGDKTRMPRLSRDPNAYIRPSPTGGTLGGVTRSTNEAITLCEGAGFDIILVETVGVGQSETAVSEMVDMFVLVIPPAAGDELQGLKKGIVELSDIILINKADGDLLPAARRIKAEYVSALKLTRSRHREWRPQVLKVSALKGEHIDKTWEVIQKFFKTMMSCGEFEDRRKMQQRLWLWNHIDWELRHRFRSHPGMSQHIVAMERRVMGGSMAPGTAADILLDRFVKIL